MFTEAQIAVALSKLDAGQPIEFAYTRGILRSSKEIHPNDDGTFSIWHAVSDAWTDFTRNGIEQVLRDQRNAWDGDIDVA